MKTNFNPKGYSLVDQIKLLPVEEILTKVGIQYTKTWDTISLYEDGKETDGWKILPQNRLVVDFSQKNRPSGKLLDVIKKITKLSNKEISDKLNSDFSERLSEIKTSLKDENPKFKKVSVSGTHKVYTFALGKYSLSCNVWDVKESPYTTQVFADNELITIGIDPVNIDSNGESPEIKELIKTRFVETLIKE